jgi:hypothetical protein
MEYYSELIFHFGCCNAEKRKKDRKYVFVILVSSSRTLKNRTTCPHWKALIA